MKDAYERLNQINQVLYEYGSVPPDAGTPRIEVVRPSGPRAVKTSNLAELKPGMPGYNSRAAKNARFQKGMQDAADTAFNVGAGAALAAGAIAAAPAVAAAAAPAAQKLTLSAALRYGGGRALQAGGGRALQAGAGRAVGSTGIKSAVSRLGSKALETVRKTAIGRALTGKLAQNIGKFGLRTGRDVAVFSALNRIIGGGPGGGGSDMDADENTTKKLKPKSVSDLDASSAGRDFEAEYGGRSIRKLRGQ
jgi:hypothetical protein